MRTVTSFLPFNSTQLKKALPIPVTEYSTSTPFQRLTPVQSHHYNSSRETSNHHYLRFQRRPRVPNQRNNRCQVTKVLQNIPCDHIQLPNREQKTQQLPSPSSQKTTTQNLPYIIPNLHPTGKFTNNFSRCMYTQHHSPPSQLSKKYSQNKRPHFPSHHHDSKRRLSFARPDCDARGARCSVF